MLEGSAELFGSTRSQLRILEVVNASVVPFGSEARASSEIPLSDKESNCSLSDKFGKDSWDILLSACVHIKSKPGSKSGFTG